MLIVVFFHALVWQYDLPLNFNTNHKIHYNHTLLQMCVLT